jgi:hypothetical protein
VMAAVPEFGHPAEIDTTLLRTPSSISLLVGTKWCRLIGKVLKGNPAYFPHSCISQYVSPTKFS